MKRYYLRNDDVITTVVVHANNNIAGVEVHEGDRDEVKEFIGQSLDELMNWMKKQGQVQMMEI